MLKKLVDYLERCSDSYYNTDNPIVNNDTYDAMVKTLRLLEPNHKFLSSVGADPVTSSPKIGRVTPMGTLSKYNTEDTVKDWLLKENDTILMCPKYDGFGVEILYHNGRIVVASTRGNGYVGEDVLSSIMKIQSVPLNIPKHYNLQRVRGEVIIPRKNHDKMKELGYTAMRNAVPGIVKSNRTEALMLAEFVAYEFFDGRTDRIEQRNLYSEFFITEKYFAAVDSTNINSVFSHRNSFSEYRENYDYEVDGIVLKTNTIYEDDFLFPKHQIAWKWSSNRETTILRDIEFNVGAAGNISVVGIFDEVEFQGAKLRRASLGSLQRYEELKPCVGDIIEVSRRGDIIPYIESVVLNNEENPYIEMKSCPCCKYPLIDYRCTNEFCEDRVRVKITQYVKYLGVKGIGSSLVNNLISNNMIKSLPDIYTLNPEYIKSIPGQGSAAVLKWKELQNKKVTVLDLLCAYPFENVGKSSWMSILDQAEYNILPVIENPSVLYNMKIKGMGSKKVDNLYKQIESNGVKQELLSLFCMLFKY